MSQALNILVAFGIFSGDRPAAFIFVHVHMTWDSPCTQADLFILS